MYRGIAKLLSLPFFDEEFRRLVDALSFHTVEKIICVQAQCGSAFAHKVMNLAPALVRRIPDGSPDLEELASIADRFDQFDLFWHLVSESKDILLLQEARMLGFSAFGRRELSGSMKAIRSNPMAKASAFLSNRRPSLPGPIRPRYDPLQGPEVLRDAELLAKDKWIVRLERLALEAGPHAKINDNSVEAAVLSSDESALLRKFALAKGAFRTLAVHVRHFERFREWVISSNLQLYPLDLQVLLKYALWLYHRGCGPTVLPSVRAAVSWVARRLRLVLPQLNDAAFAALEDSCISERAKELKEAVAYPMQLVGFMELFVMTRYSDFPVPCLVLGWVLCMVYASLRFDDAVHVHTDSLHFQDEILCGLCWQTKVERKRRGTKFAVASVGVLSLEEVLVYAPHARPWLSSFWDLLQEVAPGSRDFWMYEVNDLHSLGDGPITYQRSLKVLRSLLLLAVSEVVKLEAIKGVDFEKLKVLIEEITWHSAKVTMISASVHAGEDAVIVSIQAHHKGTGLVEKYTRSRTAISLQMIQRVTKQIREDWRPLRPPPAGSTAAPLLDDDFSENEVGEPEAPLYFVRRSTLNVTTKRILSQKIHVTAAGNPSAIACGLVEINDCEALGSVLPDVELLCKRCKSARPDFVF